MADQPRERYPHKILIVEDENAMRTALTDYLTAAGFGHISGAKDGREGLRLALEGKPDLILLDIVLPKMDGMAMLRELRKDPVGKEVRVILLTNLAADDAIMRGVILNEPSYYLVKADHSIDEVLHKVKSVLGLEQ